MSLKLVKADLKGTFMDKYNKYKKSNTKITPIKCNLSISVRIEVSIASRYKIVCVIGRKYLGGIANEWDL